MMKNTITSRLKKLGFKDPIYYYILTAAVFVFLFLSFPRFTQILYKDFLIIPCMLVIGALLERVSHPKSKNISIFSLAMVAWFSILQVKRGFEKADVQNIGLFFSTYLFAFPLATLLQDGDKKKALKIFASAYLIAAATLTAESILLVFDYLPSYLSEDVFWDGARLHVFWHSNIAACFLMIGVVFCTTFLMQAKSTWSKAGYCVLLLMMLSVLALTNCRAAIILTGGYLGATFFFMLIKHGRKWFVPGVLSVIIITVIFFNGAGYLYQMNNDLLIKKYTQQYDAQIMSPNADDNLAITEVPSEDKEAVAETDTADMGEEPLPIVINADTGEISLLTDSPQGSIERDFGTLNSRTYIWSASLHALRESREILLWGIDRPGWYVSFYTNFEISHLHNAWMQCFVGMGIIGFMLSILITLIMGWNCAIILMKYHQDAWKRNIALLVLLLLAASIMEPYLFYTTAPYHPVDFLFFLCSGYLVQWQDADNKIFLTEIRRRIPFLKK